MTRPVDEAGMNLSVPEVALLRYALAEFERGPGWQRFVDDWCNLPRSADVYELLEGLWSKLDEEAAS